MPAPKLERAVGRWQIVGISFNAVVGSGVYLVPAAAAALIGPASLWAVPLAGFAVLLLALCFAEAGSHFSEPGGAYVYTREAFGEPVGFQVGWMTWLARISSGAALWNGLAQALTFIMPGAAEGMLRVGVIVLPLLVLLYINILGVKHAARLEVLFAVVKMVPLVFFVLVGLSAIDSALIFPTPPPDAAGLAEAAALLLFAYAGFENTAAPAGEYRNPQRDVPFALVISFIAITVLYTLVQLVALGTLPDLASRTEGAALADAITLIVGLWAGIMLTAGAVVSIGGNIGNTTLVGPRYLYAMAKNGFGPAFLARIHPRYHTPAWAIAAHILITGALALSGSFVQLAMLSIVARLATYIGTAAAVPVLRRRLGRGTEAIRLPGGPIIPALALIVCLAFLATASSENLTAGLIALVVGLAVYYFRRRV